MKRYLSIVAVSLELVLTAPNVRAEIAIQNTQALAFGSFVAGNGGTVAVDTAGVRSASGDVTLLSSSEGQAASFTVSGDPNSTYSIELPTGEVKLTGTGGEMLITDFASTPFGADGQLSAGGAQILSVGATLRAGSGQAPGEYSGSFMVIVSYN